MAIRCFVAMAFDYADTDEWFDHTLTPALRSMGITVRRVDRIEHNDDIDDRIISEIQAADFVIADLTYARPSVYFEAGFAQREIPVIYTVRSDHFRVSADPANAALKVHFDLSMRNIIGWERPRDATFERRLKSRVKTVIAPLVRANERLAQDRTAAREFDQLSQIEKKAALLDGISSRLGTSVGLRSNVKEGTTSQPRLYGSRFTGGVLLAAQAIVCDTLSPTEIRAQANGRMSSPPYNLQPPRSSDRIERTDELFVIASLGTQAWARVTQSLAMFVPVDTATKHLRWIGDENWPSERVPGYVRLTVRPGYTNEFLGHRRDESTVRLRSDVDTDGNSLIAPIPRRVDVVFIDRVRSVSSALERLDAAIERWREPAIDFA